MRRTVALSLPLIVAALCAAGVAVLLPFVNFARPRALWLMIGVVAVASVWAWRMVWRQRVADQLMHHAAFARLNDGWSPRRVSTRFSLALLGFFFLALAAAQPQWGEQARRIQREGMDIVIALDASRSMLAEDAAPDRLRAATEEIDRLLQSLEGDRVGLVIFAGFAFTQSPLTSDYGAIRLYLDRVRPDAIPSQGTALGRAIDEGHRLLTGGGDPNFKRAPHQMIIVVSDGEDHETMPVDAARAAFEDGIQVFTVGIGTSTGGRIPLRDARGNFTGYLTDRNGNVVQTSLEDAQLMDIAEAGGGAYQRYTGSGTAAAFLADHIDRFDKAALSSILRAHYVDRPYFFLIPAFILLFLSLLIDERPRDQRPQKALSTWMNILWITLCITTLQGCLDFKRNDPHVRRAIRMADEGQPQAALEEIELANHDARAQHGYRFNRGRLYEALGDGELAQADYLYALGASATDLRIASMIGLGNALFLQDDFAGAIERYRRALALDPTNHAARRNLEIAHARMFPACRLLDDAFEPNDSADQSKPLPADAYTGEWAEHYAGQPVAPLDPSDQPPQSTYVVCGANDDWFDLPVEGGELVQVDVHFKRLRPDDGGPPLPDTIAPTAVRIAIVDAAGQPVAVDQGLTEDGATPIAAASVRRQIAHLPIAPNTSGYRLKIAADPTLEYSYTLSVNITPPCSALEDEFEPNDTPSTAHALDNGEHKARICVGNDDWFSVDLHGGADLFIDVTPTPGGTEPTGAFTSTFHVAKGISDPMTSSFQTLADGQTMVTYSARDVYQPSTARLGVQSKNGYEGGYTIAAYRFGACPTGNDRFEPNDKPSEATPLTAEQNRLRHLRLCPADQDWFVMELPPADTKHGAKNGASGSTDDAPNERLFTALVEFETPDRTVLVELWDPVSGQRLAEAQPLADTPYDTEFAGAVAAVASLPADATHVVVRVYGDQGYYHLRFPETEPPSPDNSSNSDEQDDNDEQDRSDDEQDPGDGGDGENDGDSDSQDDAPPAQPNDDNADDAQQQEQAEEDAKRRALLHLLESLEDDSMNLQLMQALERQPPARMQNEW